MSQPTFIISDGSGRYWTDRTKCWTTNRDGASEYDSVSDLPDEIPSSNDDTSDTATLWHEMDIREAHYVINGDIWATLELYSHRTPNELAEAERAAQRCGCGGACDGCRSLREELSVLPEDILEKIRCASEYLESGGE